MPLYNIRYMEMRKLRANPSKKTPQTPSKTSKHGASVSYDSFLFVDNVTNSRIMLKDARKHYQSRGAPCQHRLQQQQELNTLSDCLSTLKSTKLFQMDSLRTKLFRSVHARKPTTDDQLQETKRGLRQLIQASIQELSLRELRQCFSNPDHRVQPRIIALQSLSRHKLTKSNIESLLSGPAPKSNPVPSPIQRKTPLEQEQDSFQLKEEKQLMEQANNYLQNNLRSNSSHLVKPNYNRELYEKLYSACTGKRIAKKTMKRRGEDENAEKIGKGEGQGEGVFRPISKGQTATALQQKLTKNGKRDQRKSLREVLFAVQNNLFFDAEMLIMMDRSLVHAKDPQGNNLLHLAAKNRSEELFAFLLKKAGQPALSGKNNLGRTPVDLARLYGASGIVNLCENYSPYS